MKKINKKEPIHLYISLALLIIMFNLLQFIINNYTTKPDRRNICNINVINLDITVCLITCSKHHAIAMFFYHYLIITGLRLIYSKPLLQYLYIHYLNHYINTIHTSNKTFGYFANNIENNVSETLATSLVFCEWTF